jgi:hypothetical protein
LGEVYALANAPARFRIRLSSSARMATTLHQEIVSMIQQMHEAPSVDQCELGVLYRLSGETVGLIMGRV